MKPPSPLLTRLAAHAPASAAIAAGGGAAGVSYGDLGVRAHAVAAALAALPDVTGGAVAFLLEPGAVFVETLFGIWHAGALAVPLSPLHATPELAHVIADATPAVVVASRALAPRLARPRPVCRSRSRKSWSQGRPVKARTCTRAPTRMG